VPYCAWPFPFCTQVKGYKHKLMFFPCLWQFYSWLLVYCYRLEGMGDRRRARGKGKRIGRGSRRNEAEDEAKGTGVFASGDLRSEGMQSTELSLQVAGVRIDTLMT